MSIYKRIPSDLSIMLMWIIFAFIVITTFENDVFRIISGMSVILFVPGYVLVAALFPRKDDLGNIERITLSFVLSIVVVSLLGLLLNFAFGIKLIPMVITLFLWEIIVIFIAIYRRDKLSVEERFSVSFRVVYQNIVNGLNSKTKADGVLTGMLIFTIILFIGASYFFITVPKVGERFTEFYVLNGSERTDDHSTNLKVGKSYNYLVGIANHEHMQTDYTIKVILDENVLISKDLSLNHNEIWENNVTLIPDEEGTDMKFEFWLFKDNDFTEPYRRLHLWVSSTT